MKVLSHSPKETIDLGKRLSRWLKKGDVIFLFGDLGSGKTTFVKGLADGLGANRNEINSPSFVLIKEFKARLPLFHFDLYRLKGLEDFFELGFEEYLFSDGVSVIEWAERLKGLALDSYLKVEFSLKGPNQRLINITCKGSRYRNLVKSLSAFVRHRRTPVDVYLRGKHKLDGG